MAEKELSDLFAPIVKELIFMLLTVADKNNYDRDSFVKAFAKMFKTISEIATFETFEKGGDDNG